MNGSITQSDKRISEMEDKSEGNFQDMTLLDKEIKKICKRS